MKWKTRTLKVFTSCADKDSQSEINSKQIIDFQVQLFKKRDVVRLYFNGFLCPIDGR